jgi:hypothetical protein
VVTLWVPKMPSVLFGTGVLLLDVAESIMLRRLSWDRAAIVVASAEAIVGADN